jgi:hypothetical protein
MALERSSHHFKLAGRDFATAGVSNLAAIWRREPSDYKATL